MVRSMIHMLGTAASFAVLSQAGPVAAQDYSEPFPPQYEAEDRAKLAAPQQAFELTLGSGYTRGVGTFDEGPAQDVDDRVGNGVTFDLGLGYRVNPRWMVGVTGGYQMYESGDLMPDEVNNHGVNARLDATYHFSPFARVDPWVRGGAGYRLLYESDVPSGMDEARLHGIDLLGLSLGLDLRASRDFAVAPMVGADLTTFLLNGETEIDDPHLSTFFYGGLQFRLDVGGNRAAPSGVALR